MNDGLKQRIIGALVLIALGIIFVPVIFDKERIVPVDRTTQIPPEPDIVSIPLPKPPVAPRPKAEEISGTIDGHFRIEDPDALEDVSQLDPEQEDVSLAPKSPPEVEAKPERVATLSASAAKSASSAPSPSRLLDAWVLQVASYKDKSRAESLRDTLRSQGQQAFVKEVRTDVGLRVRLYIGPTINKNELELAKIEVDKHYGVNSIISRFKP